MNLSDDEREAQATSEDSAGAVIPIEQDRPEKDEQSPESAFRRTVEEGRRRLGRRLLPMAATGIVGGLDVGTGVLALLLVEHDTRSKLLGGLAFGIGFIALTLARSELFTEDFLVPVSAVVARKSRARQLPRLWVVTGVANLAGGWIISLFIIAGFPSLGATALSAGTYYIGLGLGWRAFALAVLGGLVITLMTWMQHASDSVGARALAAESTAFLLGAGGLNHAIVASIVMFCALNTGHAPFGYLAWAQSAGWATLGNLAGGLGFVTLLRLLQVPHRVSVERSRPEV